MRDMENIIKSNVDMAMEKFGREEN